MFKPAIELLGDKFFAQVIPLFSDIKRNEGEPTFGYWSVAVAVASEQAVKLTDSTRNSRQIVATPGSVFRDAGKGLSMNLVRNCLRMFTGSPIYRLQIKCRLKQKYSECLTARKVYFRATFYKIPLELTKFIVYIPANIAKLRRSIS